MAHSTTRRSHRSRGSAKINAASSPPLTDQSGPFVAQGTTHSTRRLPINTVNLHQNLAGTIKDFLRTQNIEIGHRTALELAAKITGHRDYHEAQKSSQSTSREKILGTALRDLFDDWETLVGPELVDENADVKALGQKTIQALTLTEGNPTHLHHYGT